MRRRTFMATTAASAAAVGLSGTQPRTAQAAPADHDQIIANLVTMFAGTQESNADPVAAAKVRSAASTARTRLAALAPGSAGIFAALPLGSSEANLTTSLTWLNDIAVVTRMPGAPSDLYANTQIQDRVLDAAAHLHDRWLADQGSGYYGNWFHWEIGFPTQLTKLFTLLADRVRSQRQPQLRAAVATMDAYLRAGKNGDVDLDSRFHTGANLADITGNRILQGALLGDDARIAKAVDDQATVYATVDPNNLVHGVTDGHYADGSFIQHSSVAYTGSYGKILLQRSVQTIKLLDATAWARTSTLVPVVHRWMADGFAPVIFEGWMMEAVKGRGVSRTTTGYVDVRGVIESATDLAGYLRGAEADAVKAWVKYLSQATRAGVNPSGFVSPVSIAAYQRLISDQGVHAKNLTPTSSTYAFNSMERNIHHRPGYAFALSRSSERISKYEYMSGENLTPWFHGDGAHQLYLAGVDQTKAFGVDEQVVVSPYRRPGTSAPVETRKTVPQAYGKPFYDNPEAGFTSSSVSQNEYVYFPLGTNSHSGGAHLDRFALASLELSDDAAREAAQRGKLPADFVTYANARGRRSWFMLDDEIVVLSSGITDPRGRTVVSTVDARMALTEEQVEVAGGTSAGQVGVGDHEALEWAHWHNTGNGTQVGYRFLGATDAHLRLGPVTGALNDVRTPNPATSITRQVFELGCTTPAGRTDAHAWMLLPGATRDQTRATRPVSVLANSTVAQAIAHTGLGLTMATIWDRRAHHVGDLKIKGAGSVIVHDDGDLVRVAISNPEFDSATIQVELSGQFSVVSSDEGLSARAKPNKCELVARTAGAHGASFVAVLRRR